TTVVPDVTSKKGGKKKKEIIGQFASLSITLSSSESHTIKLTTVLMPLSIVESSHHQNNNEVIGTNDSNQCIDLTSIKFNQIDNNQEDKSCNLNDDKELDTIIS
ncbi:unnamed protein product, partial [Rotaria sordida]